MNETVTVTKSTVLKPRAKDSLNIFGLLIFSLSLRILNLNVGRRWPEFEIAYPNLNIVDILFFILVLGCFIRCLILGKKINLPKTVEAWFFLLLVAAFLFSYFFVTPTKEFGLDRIVTTIEMYILYLLVYNKCRSDEDISYVIRIILLTILFQTILVFTEILFGYNFLFSLIAGDTVKEVGEGGIISERRISGAMGDSVMFAWITTFLFFMVLPFILIPEVKLKISRKYLVWAVLAVIGFGVLTITRTALFGELIIAPFIIYLLLRKYDRKLIRHLCQLYIGGILTVVFLLMLPGISDIFSRRSADIDEIISSWNLRINSFNVGMKIIEDFPITGIGVGMGGLWSYQSDFLENYIDDMDEQAQISYAGIHNGHAIIFAEMGIVGYVIYIALFYFFLRRSYKLVVTRNQMSVQVGIIGIMSIIFLIFSDFMGVSISIKQGMLYVALILGLISSTAELNSGKTIQ